MTTTRAFCAVIGAALMLGGGSRVKAQQPTGTSPAGASAATPTGWAGFSDPHAANDPHEFSRITRERMEKSRETERQRRMVADTDRLLALAAELKANMDKTSKDSPPTPEDLKKAMEIEKLARSVKERMKG